MSATVLIVDDHALVREGIKVLLEQSGFRVIGEVADGQEAMTAARELSPDVIIMDISMPNIDGITATRDIKASCPDTRIIALSIHGANHFVERMLQAGAAGYILKDSAPEQLVEAVQAVLKGETYLSPAITGLVVAQYVNLLTRVKAAGGLDKLTEKEEQYIRSLGEGRSQEEVVALLATDNTGLKSLQQAVLQKLQISTSSELLEYAGAQKWYVGQEGPEAALNQSLVSRQKHARQSKPRSPIEPLTNRELDVLELLAKRLHDKEIAKELFVSVSTVKSHVSNLLQKLGVVNRRDAAEKARQLGLID